MQADVQQFTNYRSAKAFTYIGKENIEQDLLLPKQARSLAQASPNFRADCFFRETSHELPISTRAAIPHQLSSASGSFETRDVHCNRRAGNQCHMLDRLFKYSNKQIWPDVRYMRSHDPLAEQRNPIAEAMSTQTHCTSSTEPLMDI